MLVSLKLQNCNQNQNIHFLLLLKSNLNIFELITKQKINPCRAAKAAGAVDSSGWSSGGAALAGAAVAS